MSTPPTPIIATPQVTKNTSQPHTLWLIILFVALVLVGVGGGYYAYRLTHTKATTSVVLLNTGNENDELNGNTSTFVTNTVLTNTTTNNQVLTNTTSNTSTSNVNTPMPTGGATVSWSAPKKIADLKLLGKTDGIDIQSNPPSYYQIGSITSGKYAGQKLVMAQFFYEGPQQYPTAEYYAVSGSTGTLLATPSSTNVVNQYNTLDSVLQGYKDRGLTYDSTTTLAGLFAPATLVGPKAGQTLIRDTSPVGLFDAPGLTVAFTDPVYGKVYTNTQPNTLNTNTELMSQVTINQRNGFYLKMADGMIAVYQLVFDFVKYDDTVGHGPYGGGVLQATWSNGVANTQQYSTTLRTGCGSINYTDVVSSSEVSITNDLVTVGTTATGATVYGYKDSNAKALKDWYANSYQTSDGSAKKSYVAFVADHPIVFVVDAFGRLARLMNTTYQIQAECGKPVIYLYPTTTSNVDVSLYPQGGFTASEPAYNNGWHVTAQPNGQLTEVSSGKRYPYLFWEGRGGIYTPPTQGFVIAQNDVHNFLVTKLALLGLNQKETDDFIEFWEPKMQGSPYYQVSFLGNRTMDVLAPLVVSPKPDSVIRILMDYKSLSAPVTIQPQIIHTPKRTGFTVVEWGGVLR